MQPKTEACLADIAAAGAEILSFTHGDADLLLKERLLGLATERLLLVIGEALVRLRETEPAILDSITDWRAIVGMRNAIVHGYDSVDPGRVRDAVRDNLPTLLAEVKAVLENSRA